MQTGLRLAALAFILLCTNSQFVFAQVDCSILDPRAQVSSSLDEKISASVGTLYKIAKVGGSYESKTKTAIENLQKNAPISEKGLVQLRTLYLFCGMVANATDISTERKVQLYKGMMNLNTKGIPAKTAERRIDNPIPEKPTQQDITAKDLDCDGNPMPSNMSTSIVTKGDLTTITDKSGNNTWVLTVRNGSESGGVNCWVKQPIQPNEKFNEIAKDSSCDKTPPPSNATTEWVKKGDLTIFTAKSGGNTWEQTLKTSGAENSVSCWVKK